MFGRSVTSEDRQNGEDGAPPVVMTRRAIYDLVWSQPMSSAALGLGLSANGLAKICDRLLIPYPTRGYWAKVYAGKDEPQATLPPATLGVPDEAVITRRRLPSRRPRTRMSREERREQIRAEASRIATTEGAHAVTLKRVARDIGISEAQVYNYFSSATELVVAMARAELVEMNKARAIAARGCTDPRLRYMMVTLAYLRQVSERGEIVQELLALPDVRLALRGEHEDRREANRDALGSAFEVAYDVPGWVSTFIGAMLTAMSLRGGRILARGKADLGTIEHFVMPAIGAGIDLMVDDYGRKAASEEVGT